MTFRLAAQYLNQVRNRVLVNDPSLSELYALSNKNKNNNNNNNIGYNIIIPECIQRYVAIYSITFLKFMYATFPGLSLKCHCSFLEELKQIKEKKIITQLNRYRATSESNTFQI